MRTNTTLKKIEVRKSIIPDIQTKLLALCLSDDENGVIIPVTQRESRILNYQADYVLKEVIQERIKNNSNILPLALRKKQIYEKSLKEAQKNSVYKQLEEYSVIPISLRKHLLCKDSRAS